MAGVAAMLLFVSICLFWMALTTQTRQPDLHKHLITTPTPEPPGAGLDQAVPRGPARTSSSSRCAYRCVVSDDTCPSNFPCDRTAPPTWRKVTGQTRVAALSPRVRRRPSLGTGGSPRPVSGGTRRPSATWWPTQDGLRLRVDVDYPKVGLGRPERDDNKVRAQADAPTRQGWGVSLGGGAPPGRRPWVETSPGRGLRRLGDPTLRSPE